MNRPLSPVLFFLSVFLLFAASPIKPDEQMNEVLLLPVYRGGLQVAFLVGGPPYVKLSEKALVQEEHAAALDKCPDAARANAAEPALQTFRSVDDLETCNDGRRLKRNGTRTGAMGARGGSRYRALLWIRVFGVRAGTLRGRGVDLRLQSRLDDIERACYYASKATRRRAREQLKADTNISTLLVLSRPRLELLVKHELQRRKGQVAV